MADYTIAEEYKLPSEGKIYSVPFDPKVKLRSMTVQEEMKRQSAGGNATLCEIIDDCLITKLPISCYDLAIPDYEYLSEQDMLSNMPDKAFIVILDHLEDPHNFGAIIRTCEAAGVDYIIIPKNRSVSVNSTVMKTSVGALENVKIVEVTNLNNTIKKLKANGVWVVGTDLENSVSYDKIDYNTSIALIIGSEGFGMSNLVKKNCDFIANIPMYGKINSLNASVAAGIMIYEVVRQRK